MQQTNPRIDHLERRLVEAFDQLWNDFVDPSDALYDVDGTRWNLLGAGGALGAATGQAVIDGQQLAENGSDVKGMLY